MEKYEKQIDEAFSLNQNGKYRESLTQLTAMYESIPSDDIKSLGLVGSLFREGLELSKSLYCFQKAQKSDPLSAAASLGLFHSLWRLERYDEGLNELQRFLSVSNSENHTLLLKEMEDGFFDTDKLSNDPIKLIEKIREALTD